MNDLFVLLFFIKKKKKKRKYSLSPLLAFLAIDNDFQRKKKVRLKWGECI